MTAKFGLLEEACGVHLHAKFHLNVFILSASVDPKTTILGNFCHLGLPYRPLFTDEGQIWCARGRQ